ncbi:hypothetical protein ACN20G_33300 (plasmid) [Streptomyces sp. BI20]|uniref:hypothetical protein n=1 Tax=Streptomyces sp. BI20 TaxID=3403460 RepID=UPI003C711E57
MNATSANPDDAHHFTTWPPEHPDTLSPTGGPQAPRTVAMRRPASPIRTGRSRIRIR